MQLQIWSGWLKIDKISYSRLSYLTRWTMASINYWCEPTASDEVCQTSDSVRWGTFTFGKVELNLSALSSHFSQNRTKQLMPKKRQDRTSYQKVKGSTTGQPACTGTPSESKVCHSHQKGAALSRENPYNILQSIMVAICLTLTLLPLQICLNHLLALHLSITACERCCKYICIELRVWHLHASTQMIHHHCLNFAGKWQACTWKLRWEKAKRRSRHILGEWSWTPPAQCRTQTGPQRCPKISTLCHWLEQDHQGVLRCHPHSTVRHNMVNLIGPSVTHRETDRQEGQIKHRRHLYKQL